MAHTHTLLWSSFKCVRRESLHLLLSSGRSSYFRMAFSAPFTFYLSSCWRSVDRLALPSAVSVVRNCVYPHSWYSWTLVTPISTVKQPTTIIALMQMPR